MITALAALFHSERNTVITGVLYVGAANTPYNALFVLLMKDINALKNYREKYKRHYGIEFGREYAVHHIDGNRKNNKIENLILLPLALHSKYHHYTTMTKIYAESGLSFDLTYSGICVRALQFSQLEELRALFKELQPWIEYKHIADMGLNSYPMLEKR